MARAYHRRTPEGLVIGPDAADARKLGLGYFARGLLCVIVGLAIALDTPGDWLRTVMTGVVVVGVLIGATGLVIAGLAKRNARRHTVVLDGVALRMLHDPTRAIPRSSILGVAVTQPSRSVGWLAIEVQVQGGTWLRGVAGFSLGRAGEVAAAAEALAVELGVPTQIPGDWQGPKQTPPSSTR